MESEENANMQMEKYGKKCMTTWYSVLHMLVDGLCALAMFGRFLPEKEGYLYILLYNFCAFALQMPFGVLLDVLHGREGETRDYAFGTVLVGIVCTVLGALTHPVVLGIGNALFHVGGGVGVIKEDLAGRLLSDSQPMKNWYGQGCGLGVFVAPGALGLYLGTLAAKGGVWKAGIFGVSVLTLFLCAILWLQRRQGEEGRAISAYTITKARDEGKGGDMWREGRKLSLTVCCVLVVILRSYIGMTVGFPWKIGILSGILTTLALVGGKVAGGFAAASFGMRKTAVVSLAMAAICHLFSPWMPVGLAAVFLFNMTMPVTLYWMVCHMPDKPGFAFGALTFALFLGFLPVYLGLIPAFDGRMVGCAGSLLSLVLLAACMGGRRR